MIIPGVEDLPIDLIKLSLGPWKQEKFSYYTQGAGMKNESNFEYHGKNCSNSIRMYLRSPLVMSEKSKIGGAHIINFQKTEKNFKI